VSKQGALPAELDLPPSRQRDLLLVIYASGGATLREIHARIEDPPPSHYGLRTLANRLIRRGLLKSRRSGRHSEVIYLINSDNPEVVMRTFNRVAKDHFGGSRSRAFQALLSIAQTSAGAKAA